MAPKNGGTRVIVKRRKGHGEGHHGGVWKIAYADFVTAMMAFFLVMWIITAVNKQERAAIFNYFKNPSMQAGHSVRAAPGPMGPGGASTSPINLGGGLDAERSRASQVIDLESPATADSTAGQAQSTPQSQQTTSAPQSATAQQNSTGQQANIARYGASAQQSSSVEQNPAGKGTPSQLAPSLKQAKAQVAGADHRRLESLMAQLRQAVNRSQALKPFKNQLLLDITPQGVRIQIVDAKNRPMFDLGSATLRGYTLKILETLAPYLNSVPNQISIVGHTDAHPYQGRNHYTNWELSADRANAARQALVAGGLTPGRVARVVGLASTVLFDKKDPFNPINRRISIIVMTHKEAEEALRADMASNTAPEQVQPTAPATPVRRTPSGR